MIVFFIVSSCKNHLLQMQTQFEIKKFFHVTVPVLIVCNPEMVVIPGLAL
ncbi:MAG TPA: hypothetical protein VEF34_12585 [Syntrophobacteraceae bacterium]|nr:hypothetical protein [Syntrophobacteraceae bacterium]